MTQTPVPMLTIVCIAVTPSFHYLWCLVELLIGCRKVRFGREHSCRCLGALLFVRGHGFGNPGCTRWCFLFRPPSFSPAACAVRLSGIRPV